MPPPGGPEMKGYRCSIVQRVTDGHIVVVSQDGQQEAVNASKQDEEEYLGQATRVRDPFVSRHMVG